MLLKRIGKVILYTLLTLLLLVGAVMLYLRHPKFGKLPEGARLERIQASPNYRAGVFVNQVPTTAVQTQSTRSRLGVLWEFFFAPPQNATPAVDLPVVRTDIAALDKGEDVMIWLGHSAYYLQLSGVSLLVDPTLESATPVPFFLSPFRGTDAYRAKDIPAVDYLVITHDHWDHLDYYTVQELRGRVGHYIVPLGVGAHLEHWGISPQDITELDWWEEADLKAGIHLTALPARHFSGRLFNPNTTLWASYMLQAPSRTLYLGGDSGYGPHFAQIGKRFPNIDLALLENGQYSQDWATIHMLPDSLPRAVEELGARRIFTGHNSKYKLSNHAWYEPLERASQMADERGVHLLTPRIGEVVHLSDSTQTFSRWWVDYK